MLGFEFILICELIGLFFLAELLNFNSSFFFFPLEEKRKKDELIKSSTKKNSLNDDL